MSKTPFPLISLCFVSVTVTSCTSESSWPGHSVTWSLLCAHRASSWSFPHKSTLWGLASLWQDSVLSSSLHSGLRWCLFLCVSVSFLLMPHTHSSSPGTLFWGSDLSLYVQFFILIFLGVQQFFFFLLLAIPRWHSMPFTETKNSVTA